MTLEELLALIELSSVEENAIKNNSPNNSLPLNPTAQGWSGQQVRNALSKAISGAEGSLLAELKNKLSSIKQVFEILVDDGFIQMQVSSENVLQFKHSSDSVWTDLIDLKTLIRSTIIVSETEPEEELPVNGLWFDISQ